jgi:cob(I)alamin adenosyltransferase
MTRGNPWSRADTQRDRPTFSCRAIAAYQHVSDMRCKSPAARRAAHWARLGGARRRPRATVIVMPPERDSRDTPVVLSRIYTKTGDDGTTALGDMSRARKTDPRLAAYADTDEANCAIGVAVTMGQLPDDVRQLLIRIQNELFDVGADLCNPVTANPVYPPLRVDEGYVTTLERSCDQFNADLPVLRSFVLPGGSPGAALLHQARTVVRRAERTTWAALEVYGDSMNPLTAQYLNRLSDLLFILARAANEPAGDLLWKPGGER